MFKTMLRSITDFTISGSSCNLFYQNKEGKVYKKSYYKHSKEGFYINGYAWRGVNNIFKEVNLK